MIRHVEGIIAQLPPYQAKRDLTFLLDRFQLTDIREAIAAVPVLFALATHWKVTCHIRIAAIVELLHKRITLLQNACLAPKELSELIAIRKPLDTIERFANLSTSNEVVADYIAGFVQVIIPSSPSHSLFDFPNCILIHLGARENSSSLRVEVRRSLSFCVPRSRSRP